MAKANTVETIEEYLLRLEHALAPEGEFWQNELLPQRRTRHMAKVSFSAPKERTVADIAREVELQLRDIGLWREGLSVKVKDFDWECCEIQNEGCSLIGTLWVEFGVWGDGALLWSAHANLLCDHDLTNGLGDDELDGLDELDDDEAAWWLAHGVDIGEVTDFDCPLIDMGEVELAGLSGKTSRVHSINSVKLVKTEEDAEPKQGIEGLVFDDGFVSITREEWRDRFPLVENAWGMVEWDCSEVPAGLDPEYLWTEVQVGEGFAVYNGIHRVNRYCHYISTVPVSGVLRIQVWDEPWTADEQAFVRTAITAWQRAHGVAEHAVAPDDFEQWFVKTYADRAELVEGVLICALIRRRFEDLEVHNSLEDCLGSCHPTAAPNSTEGGDNHESD